MKNFSTLIIRRLLSALILPSIVIGLLMASPQQTQAASGGRIGGGSFRAPSMPRTGGYRGGYRGGYGGYGGYGGRYGGGIGFPFILPIFGGGGLFGFLILMAIAGVIVNSVRGLNSSSIGNSSTGIDLAPPGQVSMIQLQMGLLASAKELQSDLRKLANTADTSTQSGLQKVLQETTLSLLRQPELWVYANLETGKVPFNSAETTFNRLSMIERSKLKEEVTTNVSGQILQNLSSNKVIGDADKTNEYIAATLIIASKSKIDIKESINNEDLRDALRILGSISSTDLIALEIIWQPEGSGDVLSAEELVTAYPNLKHL